MKPVTYVVVKSWSLIMSDNPFASYSITSRRKYSENLKSFCQTGGNQVTEMYAPFKRQVDFWYAAFLYAVNNELEPVVESDTVTMTPASILSTDPHRIPHIQLAYFGTYEDIEALAEHKAVFDWAQQMANAGIPRLIAVLQDIEEPLINYLEFLESQAS